VGTRNRKPTNRDRERIERAIAAAWAGIFDTQELERIHNREFVPPPYGVTVVYDSSPPAGETELPRFVYNGFYIVFALLESDSAVSEEEEQEISRDMGRAIENQFRNMELKPRIGVVTLFNCSVQILAGEGYQR